MTEPQVEESFRRWRRVGVVAWSLIGIAVLTVGGLWLLSQLSAALAPLFVGLVVVFFLKGWVQALVDRGMHRTAATAVAYAAAALIVALFFLFIIPPIARQVTEFVEAFPAFYESARDFWYDLVARYSAIEWPGWAVELGTRARDAASERAAGWAQRGAEGAFAAGSSTISETADGSWAVFSFLSTSRIRYSTTSAAVKDSAPSGRSRATSATSSPDVTSGPSGWPSRPSWPMLMLAISALQMHFRPFVSSKSPPLRR